MNRRHSSIATTTSLILGGVVLWGLWLAASQAYERELGVVESELAMALSGAVNAEPIHFERLFELEAGLSKSAPADFASALIHALPTYANLGNLLVERMEEHSSDLRCFAGAEVERMIAIGPESTRFEVGPIPLSTPLPAGSEVRAEYSLYRTANDLHVELAFEASCEGASSIVLRRLRPLIAGAFLLAIILIGTSLVSVRAHYNERAVGVLQSELIDTLAHELNTPLMTMHVATENLRRYLGEEHGHADLAVIDRQVARLQRLAESATTASRALAQDHLPRLESMTADDEVVAILEERFADELVGGQIELDLGAADDRVLADRSDLEVLVGNLVGNALKFAAPDPSVLIATSRQGADWCLVVEDDGPGMQLADRRRAWKPFQRGRAKSSHGLGLGLYLCRRIVDRLGGELSLRESTLGGVAAVVRLAHREKET